MFFMICNKTIKQPHRVQYALEEDELIQLRTACVKHGMNLKTFTRSAVVYYLGILEQKAEHNAGAVE